MMKKQNKTVRDAAQVTKQFVAHIEARRDQLGCRDVFTVGYLESFLATHADQKLLETMEQYIKLIREQNKVAA